MHTQQLHHQLVHYELFSGTSPVSGGRNSDGSSGVPITIKQHDVVGRACSDSIKSGYQFDTQIVQQDAHIKAEVEAQRSIRLVKEVALEFRTAR